MAHAHPVTFHRERLEPIAAAEEAHFWHAPRRGLLLDTIAASGLATGSRMLDVGCGTGVLAIAAAKTGSRVALGTDIDGPSVRIANENAHLNQAKATFVHASGLNDQRVRRHGPYDLVFANILAPPLVALSQDIKMALRIGGVAVLSGLLRTQERRVIAAYTSRGFRLERRIHRDAWSALVLRRMG